MANEPQQNPFDLLNRMTPSQYQAWLNGAPVAPDEPPVDASVAQANRNQRILYERHRREEDREREAARAKDVAFEAARAKQREDRDREAAKQQELDWRAEALVAWKAAGNSLYAFDLAWPDLLKQRRLTHMEEYQAKLRSGAARNAL